MTQWLASLTTTDHNKTHDHHAANNVDTNKTVTPKTGVQGDNYIFHSLRLAHYQRKHFNFVSYQLTNHCSHHP